MNDLFADDDRTGATFSPCGHYRYLLWRRWSDAPACCWVMLNPSTADAATNDPTVARCQKWAHKWGYGAVEVTNLFAYRATDPAIMKAADDPKGPENDLYITEAARRAGIVICAWGTHGSYRGRSHTVIDMLRSAAAGPIYCLKKTQGGEPQHPLYLPSESVPLVYE